MIITREQALKYHREMWREMQKELGDSPAQVDRNNFKKKFCQNLGYCHIPNNCFLCEYAGNLVCRYKKNLVEIKCDKCPIQWNKDIKQSKGDGRYCQGGDVDWRYSPISEILALPEKPESLIEKIIRILKT